MLFDWWIRRTCYTTQAKFIFMQHNFRVYRYHMIDTKQQKNFLLLYLHDWPDHGQSIQESSVLVESLQHVFNEYAIMVIFYARVYSRCDKKSGKYLINFKFNSDEIYMSLNNILSTRNSKRFSEAIATYKIFFIGGIIKKEEELYSKEGGFIHSQCSIKMKHVIKWSKSIIAAAVEVLVVVVVVRDQKPSISKRWRRSRWLIWMAFVLKLISWS